MIGTYDVKANSRKSDVILESLNRLHDAKLSGALKGEELSNIIINIGDMFANKIKQGKVTLDEIDSMESHLTGFTGENKDSYFSFPHQNMDRAVKTFFEGNDFAKEEIEKRNKYAQPVGASESYAKGFRKLGN